MPNFAYPFGTRDYQRGGVVVAGTAFFVDSGHALADDNPECGRTPELPFATWDYAVGLCSANNGDHIFLCPGHTETVTAAAGLVLDIAGVETIGLGRGSARPQVNFTTAVGADMDMDAANCAIHNVLFTGGFDALTGPIDVNAADCALINCEWRDVTGQATDVIVTDATADRLLIDGLVFNGSTAAGANSGIAIVGSDGVVIRNLRMDGNFAVGGIDIRTTACTDLEVYGVRFRTRNAADIFLVDTITASTGIIGPDIFLRLQDDAANVTTAITGATFVVMDPVYVVNAPDEKGMLINWTASTHA